MTCFNPSHGHVSHRHDVKCIKSLLSNEPFREPRGRGGHLHCVPKTRIHPALFRTLLLALALTIGASAPTHAQGTIDTASATLSAQAPALDPNVLKLALEAHDRALALGLLPNPNVLTVIDYSVPSVDPRLWVFDLAAQRLLFQELVAHGQNSGENVATRFSNAESSLESSLGLYVTGNVYVGKHGRSLKLEGLEPGFNDQAEARGIVVHAADYVSAAFASARGRLGRSWGCPALSPVAAPRVIDRIRDGSAVFAYYPDSSWIKSSSFLQPAAADSAPAPDVIAAPAEGFGFRTRIAWLNLELLEWASSLADRMLALA